MPAILYIVGLSAKLKAGAGSKKAAKISYNFPPVEGETRSRMGKVSENTEEYRCLCTVCRVTSWKRKLFLYISAPLKN